MRDYAELIKALRFAFDQPCYSCTLGEKCNWGDFCFFKRAADAIEELLAELVTTRNQLPKWVSVEERMPTKYDSVITVDKHGKVCWNYLINEKFGTWSNGYHITHWMPLPAPPKGE